MTFKCSYLVRVLTLDVPKGRVSDIYIEHDKWCPMVGGNGSKPCKPDFYLDGKKLLLS